MACPVGTDVQRAAALLREGSLVAFATETVYGLGANAFDPAAVARIFAVKNRPRFDPIIVHIPQRSWLDRLARDVPANAHTLAEKFWPGPLTLVLPKIEAVPDLVTSGLQTVAVRVPDHPLALELLRKVNLPIAAPSANLFGRLSPTCVEHVIEQLGERISYVLDGGECRVGVESTVLQLTQSADRSHCSDNTQATEDGPLLLRPGGVTVEEIEELIGPVQVPQESQEALTFPQPSPGRLPKHYAPKTRLIITTATASRTEAQRVGLLALKPISGATRFAAVEILSESGDLTEAATHFFAALRRLDDKQLDLIVAHPFPDVGLGRALNDRLQRAAWD